MDDIMKFLEATVLAEELWKFTQEEIEKGSLTPLKDLKHAFMTGVISAWAISSRKSNNTTTLN